MGLRIQSQGSQDRLILPLRAVANNQSTTAKDADGTANPRALCRKVIELVMMCVSYCGL